MITGGPSPSRSVDSTGSMSEQSDTSDEGGSPGGSQQKLGGSDICRDYLRNVCKRGKRCKFRHPEPTEARHMGRRNDYTFCHDFQNSGCRRANCRFIHCTREEEEYYKTTGQLPVRLQQAAALGIGVLPNEMPLMKGEVPICKDFLKGECKRGSRCKFRHLTPAQYEMELRKADPLRARVATAVESYDTTFTEDYAQDRYQPSALPNPYENALKRKRTEDMFAEDMHYNLRAALPTPTAITSTDYRLLEEENAMLRRKVEELKKQVSDLVATNEVLLEQNARYRSNKGLCVVTTSSPVGCTMSQVHMTQVVSSAMTPSVTPRSVMPPIAAAQTINRLSSSVNTMPQLRLDLANSELVVSQQALQPRLAAEVGAGHPGMNPQVPGPGQLGLNPAAPVSVSLNTLVPVSLSMDTLTAAPPPGSIAPVSMVNTLPLPTPVSLSQQQSSMPGGGIISSMPGGGMAIANTANTLVSYPIMSHSLTPAQHIPNSINTSLG